MSINNSFMRNEKQMNLFLNIQKKSQFKYLAGSVGKGKKAKFRDVFLLLLHLIAEHQVDPDFLGLFFSKKDLWAIFLANFLVHPKTERKYANLIC